MTNTATPEFSIVIPARNEEEELPKCLAAIQAASTFAHTEPEIVVALNRCTDQTESIAQAAGCKLAFNDTKNLASIRNAGAKETTGKFLITIDADSQMSENMLATIRHVMSTERFIGGGVMIYPTRWSLGILLTGLCLLPIALRYGISAGLFFCRREDFNTIGGFNEELASVEDIDFAKRLKELGRMKGQRYANLFRAYIISSTRKFDRFGDWYFIKNFSQSLTALKGQDQKVADKFWYDFDR